MPEITLPFPTFIADTYIMPDEVNANFATLADQALNRYGGTILGDITVAPGAKIDGVDVSTLGPTGTPTFARMTLTDAIANALHCLNGGVRCIGVDAGTGAILGASLAVPGAIGGGAITGTSLVSTGAISGAAALTLTGVITPPQIVADAHNYNPADLATAFRVRMSTDTTRALTGLVAQPAGRLLVIQNIGTADLTLAHENTSSTDVNRILCPNNASIAMKPNASACLMYDAITSRWRVVASPPGAVVAPVWVSEAFNAANFTANSGTWTVELADVLDYSWVRSGNTVTLNFALQNTSVSATPSELRIALPAGLVVSKYHTGTLFPMNATVWVPGFCEVQNGFNYVRLRRAASPPTGGFANWGTATNTSSFFGSITFEVNP